MNKLIDISNEEYHSCYRLSSTGMKEFLKSPAHYNLYKTILRKEKASFTTGTVVHMAVLENEKFVELVRPAPNVDKRTKEGKNTHESFMSDLKKDAIVVSYDDYWLAKNIYDAVNDHGLAKRAIYSNGNLFEKTGYWIEQGVSCKFRPDVITFDGCIVDLKTTLNCKEHYFNKDIEFYGYNTSMAFYSLGYESLFGEKPKNHIIIAAQKSSPYPVNRFDINNDVIRLEQGKMINAFESFRNCTEKNIWPKYDEVIHEVSVPKWATDF